jgi:hypothetical protein
MQDKEELCIQQLADKGFFCEDMMDLGPMGYFTIRARVNLFWEEAK